jgi:hypothetical protein
MFNFHIVVFLIVTQCSLVSDINALEVHSVTTFRVNERGGVTFFRQRPGHGVDHTTPSSAEVKERVQLHFYSPSVLSLSELYFYLMFFRNVSTHLPDSTVP